MKCGFYSFGDENLDKFSLLFADEDNLTANAVQQKNVPST
jgi:hypothetical protein